MLYEDGKVYIRYERKVKGKKQQEMFKKEPILLQLHPKDTNKVIRAHFKGTAPSWMKSYAAQEGYIFTDVNTTEGKGFSLTLIDKKGFIVCPFVKGQIIEWFENVGDGSYEEFQDTLLANLEIVEKNLRYHAKEFHQYGLFHRVEEIKGQYSSLALSPELQSPDNFEELTKPEQVNWKALIQSLITERDYPLAIDEEDTTDDVVIDIDEEDTTDDVVIAIDEEDTTDDVVIDIDEEDTTDDVVIAIDEEDTTDDVVIAIDEEDTTDDVVIAIDEEGTTDDVVIDIDEEGTTDDVVIAIDEGTTDDVEPVIDEEPTDDVEPVKAVKAPKIATRNSRKDGVIEGQMFLF